MLTFIRLIVLSSRGARSSVFRAWDQFYRTAGVFGQYRAPDFPAAAKIM